MKCKSNFIYFLQSVLLFTLQELTSEAAGVLSRNGVMLEEVPFGETVVLKCRSNIGDYNFDYWLVNNGADIIGPSNEDYDNTRYKYEVLSGNLTVVSVSQQEEGLYSCVSKAIRGNNIKIERVKMLVLQVDFEEEYEHNSYINTIRILIILITLVLLGIGGYVVFRIWRDRFKHPSYLEQDDEETTEEVFRSPGSSGISRSRSPVKIIVDENTKETAGNSNISTDFGSFLDHSSKI
ncbi:unnamed protein product [Phaedon cochleariae]|uniref:Ig-like domain-containing protein n=1 Tax=Phaedon cochleariae TaxID=80249 RepID=A0A9P0GU44_PHACE|nr:unnamed protein product [Phaedon cochleariae]